MDPIQFRIDWDLLAEVLPSRLAASYPLPLQETRCETGRGMGARILNGNLHED